MRSLASDIYTLYTYVVSYDAYRVDRVHGLFIDSYSIAFGGYVLGSPSRAEMKRT